MLFLLDRTTMSDEKTQAAVPPEEKLDPEQLKGGAILRNRSCTDCPCIIVAFVFIIGWIIIISVAASLGVPARLLMPANFDNQLCGDAGPLQSYGNLFIPRPSRYNYGLCVSTCPMMGDFICNARTEAPTNDITSKTLIPNFYYNHTQAQYIAGAKLYTKCLVSCNATEQAAADRWVGLNQKIQEYKCFMVLYNSGPIIFRCIPLQDQSRQNATLLEQAGEGASALNAIADYTGAATFFASGFYEMQQCWLVILISAFTCMVLSLLWLVLLRWILAPLVYLCILLILALLIVVGYLAMRMGDDLENVTLPGDTATGNQLKLWRALQYSAWILAAMYVVIMLWMIKRIRIAISIMKQGSRAFLNTPTMALVPPITFLLVLGWTAFFIVTAVYIQTVGELKPGVYQEGANAAFGAAAVNYTLYYAQQAQNRSSGVIANYTNSSSNASVQLNTTSFSQDEKVKIMHAYNFFGYLWTTAFCIMLGYFCMAMSVSAYYFSASQIEVQQAESSQADEREKGKTKHSPPLAVLYSLLLAFRYHLGTILFGSLLIAIIQFIRALALYLEEQFLNQWKDNPVVKFLKVAIDCFLACIERCIKIISKNAFIVTCVKNTRFCPSAITAMKLLLNNIARVGILGTLCTVACWVLKVFIVGCNCIIAWGLIHVQPLTLNRPIESGLFPLVGILFLSFIIASLFINVYECAVDTIMMCFLIDESEMNATFLDLELADLLGLFKDAEEARLNYEKQLHIAVDGKKPETHAEEPGKH